MNKSIFITALFWIIVSQNFAQSNELKLFWNPLRQDNFTSGTTDGYNAAKAAKYTYIRSEGFTYQNPTGDMQPLILYYSVTNQDNFSSTEVKPPKGYQKIRTQGYVYASQQKGTLPLKIYYNEARKDYMTLAHTDSEKAAKSAGYRYVKTVGHIAKSSGLKMGTLDKIYKPLDPIIIPDTDGNTLLSKKPQQIIDLALNKRNSSTFQLKTRLLKPSSNSSALEEPVFDIPVNSKSQSIEIGRGFNSLLGEPRFPAINPPDPSQIRQLNTDFSDTYIDYVKDVEDIDKHLGVDVSVSGSYLMFSGSSKTSYVKDESINKYNETLFVNALTETFKEFPSVFDMKLSDEAKTVLKNQGVNAFYQLYGDCFVYAIQYGAGYQATGSYKLYKSDEKIKFSNESSASGGGLGWSANISVKVDKSTRTQKENEHLKIEQNKFGFRDVNPNSIKQMRTVYRDFGTLAGDYADQSSSTKKYGGVLYYTVVKYNIIPDFQQLAKGSNKMNIKKARLLLDELFYYRRKIGRMHNNLIYIQKNEAEFTQKDFDAANKNIPKLNNYLNEINRDIASVAQNPFDDTNLNSLINKLSHYKNIPDYAPDYTFIRVEIDFPAIPENPTKTVGSFTDHNGPLIGYKILSGDGDVWGNRKIDVNIHSILQVKNGGRDAVLLQKFLIHENKGDHTKIGGEKELVVYKAPEGYKIVGFKKNQTDYYLRNLGAKGAKEAVEYVKEKEGDLWTDLRVMYDSPNWDYPDVGLYGKMVIYVKLTEI